MAVAAIAMAATMFAADVAAAIQGYGDLFSVEAKKDAKVNVLGWNDPWDRQFSWYSTGIGFSATADKAGLSFELDGNNSADNGANKVTRLINVKNSVFWIQPIDMVKIALGANSIGMAKETIDYDGTVFNNDYEGWKITVTPIEGLTIDAGLVTTPNGGWATGYWIAGGVVGESMVSVAYNAGDIGTFTAIYDYNNKKNTVALDYVGNFGGVMVSPAVCYAINDKTLAADLFVTANVAGVGINAYAKYAGDFDASNAVTVNTKFTYNTAIGQASLQLKDADVLASDFAMMAKADLAFNCGSAGMNVGLQFDIADTVKISVPFQYNLHF